MEIRAWMSILLFVMTVFTQIDLGTGFIEWGSKCRFPSAGESLSPDEECDDGHGISCQKYQQGNFCGCRIDSAYSYDRASKECRRKVGQICEPRFNETADPVGYKLAQYNSKCHTRAECKEIDNKYADQKETKATKYVCQCKQGYISNRDLSACDDPSQASKAFPSLLFPSILTLFIVPFGLRQLFL